MAVRKGRKGHKKLGLRPPIPDEVELSLPLSLGTGAGHVLTWSGSSLFRLLLLLVLAELSCELRACRSNKLSSASELPCDFEKKPIVIRISWR